MMAAHKFDLPDGRRGRVILVHNLHYVIQVQCGEKAYRTLHDEGTFSELVDAIRMADSIARHGL